MMSAVERTNGYDLTDRVVLVAGALGELGQAATRAFVEAGATVAALARAEGPAWASLRAALGPRAERLTFVAADAQDEASVARAVAAILAQHGHLDVLANTIGGYDAGQPVTALALETWQQMLDLNLRSAFLLAKHAGEAMRQRRWGRIIHTSSRAAFSGQKNAAAYAVAKRGVLTLVEAQADELRRERVTVNAILPSTIDTPANRAAMPSADFSRWPRPEAVARVMLFLASDDAELISGAAIPVYGQA
jgi:NAD(P)-dependent dehydrogenase (short-subunit alcohol dehydrogenase family)